MLFTEWEVSIWKKLCPSLECGPRKNTQCWWFVGKATWSIFGVSFIYGYWTHWLFSRLLNELYYTTRAVRGPITKINQLKCSIAGPIFSKYWTGHCPEWSRTTCAPLNLKFKMADEDEIFRKFRRKTLEWMADFEKRCFSLELEIFKSRTNDGAQLQQWKHRVRAR